MKFKYLIALAMTALIPLASATKYFAAFDLFNLFVENIFGSIVLAGIGIAVMLLLIGMAGRMSGSSVYIIVGTFMGVYAAGYSSAIAGLIFAFAALYGISGLIKWLFSG